MFYSNYPQIVSHNLYPDNAVEYDSTRKGDGFTTIEILIVVVIIAIAAFTAIPMMSSAASMQVRSASNMIIGDLEYAKSIAITRSQSYSVVFDTSDESYQIEDLSKSVGDPDRIIKHPVKKGFDYIIDFKNDSRLNKVNIVNTTFTDDTVSFDSLGSPDNGGTITIEAGGDSITITVEPVTGYVRIE